MADQQNAGKEITPKEKKRKLQADIAKAAEPVAIQVASPPTVSTKESVKKGKLLPKNKHRLPRRQKKAQQKAAVRL